MLQHPSPPHNQPNHVHINLWNSTHHSVDNKRRIYEKYSLSSWVWRNTTLLRFWVQYAAYLCTKYLSSSGRKRKKLKKGLLPFSPANTHSHFQTQSELACYNKLHFSKYLFSLYCQTAVSMLSSYHSYGNGSYHFSKTNLRYITLKNMIIHNKISNTKTVRVYQNTINLTKDVLTSIYYKKNN